MGTSQDVRTRRLKQKFQDVFSLYSYSLASWTSSIASYITCVFGLKKKRGARIERINCHSLVMNSICENSGRSYHINRVHLEYTCVLYQIMPICGHQLLISRTAAATADLLFRFSQLKGLQIFWLMDSEKENIN